MSRSRLFFSLLLLFPMGCSQFQTGRSFLTEMEHEDFSFYHPHDDFPVVSGDTGRDYMTEKERRSRTPASQSDLQETQASRALRSELKGLESGQSEENLEFYEKHKHQLGTTSEKIYFLKLPARERRDYLLSRGFLQEEKGSLYTDREKMFAMKKQDILLGMTKAEVMRSWGKPLQVDYAGNPRNENERWLYRTHGAAKYIYFESGEVQGWE